MPSQELDIFLMTEVGLCWPKVFAYDQWNESIFISNKTELEHTTQIQHGGVGICATDKGVHRIINTGQD
jgi:hypothetical protein